MKIGIALAAYRPDLEFFNRQLDSIQKQTYSQWICIVTSDSSLAQILSTPAFQPIVQDPRFQFIENSQRLGHKKNFEKAIQEVLKHGVDWIACSDQDDIWYTNKLEEGLKHLCEGTHKRFPALVHSDMHILQNDRILSETAWSIEKRGIKNNQPIHLYVRNLVAGCSMLFNAALAKAYPLIPDEAEYHDHWYALVASYQLFGLGGITEVFQPLYIYRQHGRNEVGVSPFNGITAVPGGIGIRQLLDKCKKGYLKSYRLFKAAQAQGLPVRLREKILFYYSFDLGLGLLMLGLFHLRKDPPLARACFARAIGKMVCILGKVGI